MKYAVFDPKRGYMCDGEDGIGVSYDHEIDEFTVLFDKEKDAQFNCGYGTVKSFDL